MKHIWKFTLPAHLLGAAALYQVVSQGYWGLLAIAGLFWALLSIGVEVGVHRLFSHQAFTTPRWIQVALMYLGSIAGQGSIPFWVAVHKGYHHPHADTERDLHSPVNGIFQAYVGWLIDDTQEKISYRSAVGLMRDPAQKFFHDHYYSVIIATVFVLALVNPLLAGMYFLASSVAIQQNFIVNVICHNSRFGDRAHEVKDLSRNVRWFSLISWGLSLHNNHHFDPGHWSLSRHPGELDPSAWVIKLISSSRRDPRVQP